MANREKEIKTIAVGLNYAQVYKRVKQRIEYEKITQGEGPDHFWALEDKDFVRWRPNAKGLGKGELTVKIQDRGSVRDRKEVNIPTTSGDKVISFCESIWGKGLGATHKDYHIFHIKGDIEISLYVTDFCTNVFLEVEAPTLREAEEYLKELRQYMELEVVHKSLYEMYKESLEVAK